ncbi:uncharacterized protein LOC106761756 isoform X1 [Vigna radiata var. radiata]|uniref:Uncharacterized protein LOC106761756 isoform X1 n=1 Tax=Vigna radiata var. radiata TaxID=3916 RepID=A0A3Q0F1J7_VIGRR|nr:uncharacterized protein LOC106761756 isoform X1 [Vigna radiata var. radiata]
MPKRFPHVFSNKNFIKHLQSTTPITAIVSSRGFCIPNADAHVHTQVQLTLMRSYHTGGDSIVGAAAEGGVNATEAVENVGERAKETAKKTAEFVAETTTAEADTNVVDTAEYRCSEDLGGHLGDGHDSYS